MITWDIKHGSPSTYLAAFDDALDNGTLLAGSASTTHFTLAHGGSTIVFDGTFTIDGAGVLTGGTITGFHLFGGALLLLDASGYAVAVDEFLSGNAASPEAILLLLHSEPITINGSSEDDIISGGLAGGRLFGNGGADYIEGGYGNQFISGGPGSDTLVGDVGDHMATGIDTVDYSQKTGSLAITLNTSHATTVYLNGIAEDTIDEFENANGGAGNDRIIGSAVANRLVGNHGNDVLIGGAGTDVLSGSFGRDTLKGGLGKDVLAGGLGVDRFDFNTTAESQPGALRDVIQDFSRTQHDRIDLRDIDANSHAQGTQAFHYIGSEAFSHTAGELRFAGHVLRGDVNGDGVADIEVRVAGAALLLQGDLIL